MTDVHMTIHPILAKPVATMSFDPTKEMHKFLTEQELREENNFAYGGSSTNVMILRDLVMKDLRDVILKNAAEMAREVMGIDTKEMVDVLSWVTVKKPNQYHTGHYHPNSIISGVYFFDDHTENMPLVFEESVAIANDYILRPRTVHPEEMAKVPFPTPLSYAMQVNKGSLLLFPSYVKHCVAPNNTPFNRYSLAFNLVPKEGLGNQGELTRLHYEDVL